MSQNHLLELAQEIVKRALAAGATDAECTIAEGEEFSANVRMREIENLKEAGSRGAGLRILRGKHTGSSYTSDLSRRRHRASRQVRDRTGRHHHRGSACGTAGSGRVRRRSTGIWGSTRPMWRRSKPAEDRHRQARRRSGALRRSADLQLGRRLVRQPYRASHLREFARIRGRIPLELLLAEHGPGGARRRIDGARLLVHDGARVRRAGTAGAGRADRGAARPAAVESGEGRDAEGPDHLRSERGARSLLDNIFEAVHGTSVYRHESFLAGKLGEKVASELPDRDRRRHDPRAVRHLAVRR